MNINKLGGLDEGTRLYRYVDLSLFMSFVETHIATLTKVKEWDDTWEIPFRHIAIVLNGIPTWQDNPNYDQIFAQCWSLSCESDALWRIYSQNREGLIIGTTAKQFDSITGIKDGILAPVIYFDDVNEGYEQVKEQYGDTPITGAFLKRKAFEHEKEVRLATLNDEDYVDRVCENSKHIGFNLDPIEFIGEIIIDPRANDWYVDTIQEYCRRIGFSIVPIRSNLYAPMKDKLSSLTIKLTRRSGSYIESQ